MLALFSSCRRPCEGPENCARTCTCVDADDGSQQQCAIGFQCDVEATLCEAPYDALSCDDVCNTYLNAGQCGQQRCVADTQCARDLQCPCLDGNGSPIGGDR